MKHKALKFTLTDRWLNEEERATFDKYLNDLALDVHIWSIFETLFRCGDDMNRPVILRAYTDDSLVGAIIILKCRKYGKSLFKNKLMWKTANFLSIPVYLWVRLGCCMDLVSNPGFFVSFEIERKVLPLMIEYLRKRKLLTLATDYSDQSHLYAKSCEIPALPQAVIKIAPFKALSDYLSRFKNMKRKFKYFKKKGGEVKILHSLDKDQLGVMKDCFDATCKSSVFYLPYQDLYNRIAVESSSKELDQVYFFVAQMNGRFIGYQAALKSGNHLNALHGAFDRKLKTTFHAYEILICLMVDFAIENNLDVVDLGAVINHTKKRMINQSRPMSYFLLSKFALVKRLFRTILSFSNIQSQKHLQFR